MVGQWSPTAEESDTSSTSEANVEIGSMEEQMVGVENTLTVEDVDNTVREKTNANHLLHLASTQKFLTPKQLQELINKLHLFEK